MAHPEEKPEGKRRGVKEGYTCRLMGHRLPTGYKTEIWIWIGLSVFFVVLVFTLVFFVVVYIIA